MAFSYENLTGIWWESDIDLRFQKAKVFGLHILKELTIFTLHVNAYDDTVRDLQVLIFAYFDRKELGDKDSLATTKRSKNKDISGFFLGELFKVLFLGEIKLDEPAMYVREFLIHIQLSVQSSWSKEWVGLIHLGIAEA